MSTATLRPSQVQGVDFLSTLRNAILADDTGLGKSAQSIRAADQIGARRVLILCQPIGRVSWAKEVPLWQTLPREVVQFEPSTKALPLGDCVVIAAFSSLSRKADLARLRKALWNAQMFSAFDLVIIDEAHHLANVASGRTKAVYGKTMDIAGGVIELVEAKRVWLLSATLQRNNASELFPHLRALFPEVLAKLFGFVPKAKDFIERYCKLAVTPFGANILGNDPDTIPELREALRPYILRRLKKDVARELGPIQNVTLPLPIDPVQVKLAARADSDMLAYLDALEAGAVSEDDLPVIVSALWRTLGEFKAAPSVEWIKEFLDNNPDRKLVVFAHHRAVISTLLAGLAQYLPCGIDGSTSPGRRAGEVDTFQTDPKARVMIAQTIAAGTSITLTAASDVLMVEQEWTPADNYQAVSRVHRIGQTNPVTVYHAYAAGTVDERIAARARRKAADFDDLIGQLTEGTQE